MAGLVEMLSKVKATAAASTLTERMNSNTNTVSDMYAG